MLTKYSSVYSICSIPGSIFDFDYLSAFIQTLDEESQRSQHGVKTSSGAREAPVQWIPSQPAIHSINGYRSANHDRIRISFSTSPDNDSNVRSANIASPT